MAVFQYIGGGYNRPEPEILNQDAIIFWDRETKGEQAIKQVQELMSNERLLNDFIHQPRITDHAEECILDTYGTLMRKIENKLKK